MQTKIFHWFFHHFYVCMPSQCRKKDVFPSISIRDLKNENENVRMLVQNGQDHLGAGMGGGFLGIHQFGSNDKLQTAGVLVRGVVVPIQMWRG